MKRKHSKGRWVEYRRDSHYWDCVTDGHRRHLWSASGAGCRVCGECNKVRVWRPAKRRVR